MIAQSSLAGHHSGGQLSPTLVINKNASGSDRAAVETYMQAQGFKLERRFRSSTALRFKGSPAQVEQTFGVTINDYTFKGRTFFANAGPIVVPAAIAAQVTSVLGLNNGPELKPLIQRKGSAPQPAASNGTAKPAAAKPAVTTPLGSSPPYTPAQLKTYYGVDALNTAGFTGSGKTIGIVTFAKLNNSDDLSVDVRPFESGLGLPQSSISFRVDPNEPQPSTDSFDTEETVLDVSWASAMAPGASIVVEEATNGIVSFADAVEDLVTAANPDVISMSWDTCEAFVSANEIQGFNTFISTISTPVFIASGDSGSNGCGGGPSPSVNWPASDPFVTAVGGTSIPSDVNGDPTTPEGSWLDSGGGFSGVFPLPSYQSSAGVSGPGRGVPDIALLADPATGFLIHDSSDQFNVNGWVGIGGTSGAAPTAAGMFATIDQAKGGRLSEPAGTSFNTLLYPKASSFSDINDKVSNGAYSSAAGWDPVTGLGSINASTLASALTGVTFASTPTPVATAVTSIHLVPASGQAGVTVGATGSGFLPRATLTLTFTDGTVTTTTQCPEVSTTLGGFDGCPFVVPSTAGAGAATVSVTDGTSTGTATFTVAAPTSTYNVNTTADALSAGACASAAAGCSLREAINEASAAPSLSAITINVPAGTYSLTTAQPLQITGGSSITISGAGAGSTIIDGGGSTLVLSSGQPQVTVTPTVTPTATPAPANPAVVLSGVTIQNGSNTIAGGGGIQNVLGTMTLNNVTVSGNSASSGGGIFNGDTMTLNSSTVSGNKATVFGGAGIENDGMLTLNSSTISSNSANNGTAEGGGLANFGEATISNSSITGNSVALNTGNGTCCFEAGGGGILNGGFLTLTNSHVDGNTAGIDSSVTTAFCCAPDGGGLKNWSFTQVTANGGSFSNNTSFRGGGFTSGGTMTLTNVTISGNHANESSLGGNSGQGGGAYVGGDEGGNVTFNNSTITGNAASGSQLGDQGIEDSGTGSGGGLSVKGHASLNSTIVSSNTATWQGGGIWVADWPGTLEASNSQITGNTANWHGGGIATGGLTTLTGTTVSNNTATGVSPAPLNCCGSPLAGDGNGGGIHVGFSGSLGLINSTIGSNKAGTLIDPTTCGNSVVGGDGGGISGAGALQILDSTINGNTSTCHGGGLTVGSSLTATNTTISGNTASGDDGGAMYVGSGPATLNAVTISGNSATAPVTNTKLTVGAIANPFGDTVSIANSIVADATAACDGLITDGGYNLFSDSSCDTSSGLSVVNATTGLLTLVDNGGPTLTIGLGSGSPALDAVPKVGVAPSAAFLKAAAQSKTLAKPAAAPRARPANHGAKRAARQAARPKIAGSTAGSGAGNGSGGGRRAAAGASKAGTGSGQHPNMSARMKAHIASLKPPAKVAAKLATMPKPQAKAAPKAIVMPAVSSIICANGMPDSDQRHTGRPLGAGCDIGAFEAAAQTTATASVQLLPPSGAPGTNVTINGAGFTPSSSLTIMFNGANTGAVCSTDANGVVGSACVAVIPSSASAGAATVSVSDGTNTATATFTVTAAANAFTVTTTNDTDDASLANTGTSDSICDDGTGACSLRAAIEEADALASSSTIQITLPAGTYMLTNSGSFIGQTLMTNAPSLVITGAGAGSTMIDGAGQAEVLFVSSGAVTLSSLTVQNGNSCCNSGGGISNSGTLTLNNVSVLGNTAGSNAGGGVYNQGALTVNNSTIGSGSSPNSAGAGGGIYNANAATITNSTVAGNSSTNSGCCAGNGGGGILNAGTLTVAHSTISGNTSAQEGGGVFSVRSTSLTVSDSTVSGNIAAKRGGGINVAGSTAANITRVTLSGNSTTQTSCCDSGGGAIANRGAMLLAGSNLNTNTGGYDGGAIKNSGGGLTVRDTLIDGNTAGTHGGGIANGGGMTVVSSTLSGNTASADDGGAVWSGGDNPGATVLDSVTLAGNTAASRVVRALARPALALATPTAGGAALSGQGGALNVQNSIVVASGATSACDGFVADGGYNIYSDGSCDASSGKSLVNTDPQLQPLASNGGPQQTMALAAGSPAYDVIPTGAVGASLVTSASPAPHPRKRAGSSGQGAAKLAAVLAQRAARTAPKIVLGANVKPIIAKLAAAAAAQPKPAAKPAVVPLAPELLTSATGPCANGVPATDMRRESRPLGSACDIGAYEGPAIGLSATSATVGTALTIDGAGYLSSAGLTGTFVDAAGTKTTLSFSSSCTSDSSGNANSCGFSVPAGAGPNTLVILSDGNNATQTKLTLLPSISLSPTSGLAGSSVSLAGNGFAANAALSATFTPSGGSAAPVAMSCTSGANGSVPSTCSFTVPSVSAGAATVAISDGTNSASASFTVTSPPSTSTGGSTNPPPTNGVTTIAPGVTSQGYINGSPDPTTLTGTVINVTNVAVNSTTGATITDGNFVVSIPPNAFSSLGLTNFTIDILVSPTSVTGLAGSVSASPNGTTVDIVVRDPATGKAITISPTLLQLFVKPTAADIAMLPVQGTSVALRNGFQDNVGGPDFSRLNAVYFVAPDTDPAFNPLGLPAGTPLFVHNFKYDPATGLASWDTQNLAGVVQAIVANPVSYVQTLNADTQEYSSFDPDNSQSFGGKPQFSYLQVVSPQIPVDNRLVVLDPDTGNYSYVNAADVAPSGPPPTRSSSAVVRGLLGDAALPGEHGAYAYEQQAAVGE